MKKILMIVLLAIFHINVQSQCMLNPVLLNQRISQSSTVIEGKVISQQSFWDHNHHNIYTSNLVEVYKSFKSSSPNYIEIITEGGTVGNDKEVVEPSLELSIGEVGIFTLNENTLPNQFGKQVYEAYAGPQGCIKYNIEENSATEPFRKYNDLSSSLYSEIQQYTHEDVVIIQNTNPFVTTESANRVGNVAATITNFSPTTITAGTFSVLTINGSGFGATQGTSFVEFKRADDGGATFCRPDALSYLSWSDTQIQVKVTTTGASTVNSTPGTGVIRVDVGGVKTTSTATLTIPYAQMNVYSNGAAPFTIYNTRHVNKQSGGYIWQMYTGFDSNTSAKSSFLRAFQSWRCGTYVNWTTGTTTTVNIIANDGVNVIRFDVGTELPSGVLGRCTSRWSGCGTNPSQNWYVNELDIVFDDAANWNYGPAAPGFSQYDFESVAVHELGHGHQLGHVINSAEIMNYSITNGQQKRTLSVNDLAGGNSIMTRNLSGGVCSISAMTALTSGNCAIGAPTASFTANRTTVCPGQTVVFTDASVGNPTSWSWSFAGGTPSTSAVQNPTITYNTPGTYSVTLTASNTAGTNTYSVAAYITVTSAASLPLTEGFQATFPPTNWSVVDGGNDGVKWSLSTSAGQASTQSALFDNFNTDVTGTRDELKTVVNLSGFSTAKMTFYRAYGATFASPNIDSLEIRVSTNCGSTSTQAYIKGGAQIGTGTGNGSTIFVPTATQWAKDSIDLTSYVGQSSVMISLINRSQFGDGMYLDNINITGTTASVPNATINSVSSACAGQAITFSCTTTGSPTSYSWSTAGGTPSSASTQTTSVTYTIGGVYSVSLTVANATGTTTTTKSITITPTPTVIPSFSTTAICLGSSTTLSVTGATSYTWLPTGTGTVSVLSPTATTVYSITGSVNGCVSAVKNVTVTVNGLPTTTASTSGTLTCSTLSVGLNSSLAGMTYTWSAPASGSVTNTNAQNTGATGPGIYTLTVVNPTTTCSFSTTTSVSQNTIAPSVAGSTTGTLTCLTLTASARATTTVTPVSYTWTGAGITAGNGTGTITVNQPGSYNYTVTNTNNGCKTTGTQAITQNTTMPTGVNAGSNATLTCISPSVALNGSVSTPTNATVLWSGSSICGSATSLSSAACTPGVYTLTATNPANGCSATSTVQVFPSSGAPSVIASNTGTLNCINPTVQVVATTSVSSAAYSWSGPGIVSGASTASATVNASGIYTVVVTNTTSGCSSTATTSVTQNTTIPVVTGAVNGSLTCTTLTVTANATTTSSPVSYNWTGTGIVSGAATGTITANQAGTYNYTVTNTVNGCQTTGTRSVTQNTTMPVVTGAVNGTLTCTTLTVTANATTTTSPVSYNWTGTGIVSGAATGTITANQVGSYNYTVTNTFNGCKATGTRIVTQNTIMPTGVSAGSNATLSCASPSVALNGSVSTPTNATVLWSGASVCGSSTNLSSAACAAGIYTLTATNPTNGCYATSTVQIFSSVGAPSVLASTTGTLNCINPTTQVVASTTTSPVTYSWSGPGIVSGASTASATVNSGGVYTVVVTNTTSGCSSIVTTAVTQNTTMPSVTGTTNGTLTCTTLTVTANATTTSSPVSYNWTGAGIVSGSATGTITANQAGAYNYTVTNTVNGCQTTGARAVTQNTVAPSMTLSPLTSSVCLGSSKILSVTTASANNISWSTGASTASISVTPTNTTNYTVTVTNPMNGCAANGISTVSVIANPTVVATATNVTCNGLCNGIINATATGGSGFTFSVNGSSAAMPSTGLCASTYSIMAANSNGCSNTTTIQVTQPSVLSTSVSTTDVNCFGMCNGSINIIPAGGTWPCSFGVTNGVFTSTVQYTGNLCTGLYTVSVTDANGCNKTTTTTITQPPQLIVTATNTAATCSSCADGIASVNLSGGSPNYTFVWSPGGMTTSTAVNLPVNCYTVTVTDSKGCQDTASTCVGFSTGINELLAGNHLSLYPNPSNGIVTINSNVAIEKMTIVVMNAIGQTILNETNLNTNQSTIDLSKISKGIYYVKVSTEIGSKQFRLILE